MPIDLRSPKPLRSGSMLSRRGLVVAAGASLLAAPALLRRGHAADVAVPVTVPGDGDMVGELTYFLTRENTILLDVAWQYDLGLLEVTAVNPGVDPWIPGAQRMILLPTAHLLPVAKREGVVINKSELRLYHFTGGTVQTHAIGVGREGHSTPDGLTTIVRKRKDPTWYPTASTRKDRPELPAQVGPGPENPLGDRAMYFGWPTYLMHGTNKPYGVGRLVSRGCIRLYPEVSRLLFEALAVGTRINVIEQPIKVGWHRGGLFLEVHPDCQQLDELENTHTFAPTRPAARDQAQGLIEAKVGDAGVRIDWLRVDAELRTRRGIPIQIAGAPVTISNGVRPTLTPESIANASVSELVADDEEGDGGTFNPAAIPPARARGIY